MNRRGFLTSILALGAAPAIVRAANLMKVVTPSGIVAYGGLITPEVGSYIYLARGNGKQEVGSFVGAETSVLLGWKPEFLLIKRIDEVGPWVKRIIGEDNVLRMPIEDRPA